VAYAFDGINKTITLSSPISSLTFSNNDLYSRAVDWVADGGSGFEFPFQKTVGGEGLGSGQTAGFYLFLGQGWTIIVPVGIDSVTVQGNFLRDPDDLSGAPLFTNSAGALITIESSVVALGYSTGGGGFTSSDRATLTTSAANTATLTTRISEARATALDLLSNISERIYRVWQRNALDASNPVTRAKTGADVTETFDDVTITHDSNGTDSVTSTRS
jgi:hypothetical protein